LFDSAVNWLVSRLSIVDKLSCGIEEVEGVGAGLDVAAEYVSEELCERGGGGVVESVVRFAVGRSFGSVIEITTAFEPRIRGSHGNLQCVGHRSCSISGIVQEFWGRRWHCGFLRILPIEGDDHSCANHGQSVDKKSIGQGRRV